MFTYHFILFFGENRKNHNSDKKLTISVMSSSFARGLPVVKDWSIHPPCEILHPPVLQIAG